MAYDELLADRMAQILHDKHVKYTEKKMMGGLTFMVDEKMCVGIVKNNLMVRHNPDDTDKLMKIEGCVPMDFTKRPMKGFAFIQPDGYDLDKDLEFWIQVALDYNPLAKKSKKKIKK